MWLDDDSIQSMVGISSIALSGFSGISAFVKLFDRDPGLIFSAAGILDNSTGVSPELIPWSEIMGARPYVMHKLLKALIIDVKEPQKYLGRGSWLKQFGVNSNYKFYGSPVRISTVILRTSFAELLSVFNRYQQKYGAEAANQLGLNAFRPTDLRHGATGG
jgi:hypothetical protein